MDIARSVVHTLCIVFGVTMGRLWIDNHHEVVIISGIVWLVLLFAFFFVMNYIEARQKNYSGRHRV